MPICMQIYSDELIWMVMRRAGARSLRTHNRLSSLNSALRSSVGAATEENEHGLFGCSFSSVAAPAPRRRHSLKFTHLFLISNFVVSQSIQEFLKVLEAAEDYVETAESYVKAAEGYVKAFVAFVAEKSFASKPKGNKNQKNVKKQKTAQMGP